MFYIHDRRPLVIGADAVREWLSAETIPQRAAEIVHDSSIPDKEFTWHPASKKVGDIHNQGEELANPVQEAAA